MERERCRSVTAVDTNVLVYAHRRESAAHRVAFRVMRELAEGSGLWAIPWPCCFEFLSIVTNRRIWKDAATPPEHAWCQLRTWVDSPSNRLLGETDGFLEVFGTLCRRPKVRGPVVHDARVAALCLVHGAEALLTRDRDFRAFPELPTRDPFRGSGSAKP